MKSAVERAKGLQKLIDEHGAEIDRRREVTPEVVEALVEADMLRLLLPRNIGGQEMLMPSMLPIELYQQSGRDLTMGEILFRTRLSKDMFRGLAPWMQSLPGRLLHVNVVGCAIFAAVCGQRLQFGALRAHDPQPHQRRRAG